MGGNPSREQGPPLRRGRADRTTGETDVQVTVTLDGDFHPDQLKIDTGIPFFDHMLTALATTARFGLEIKARGDLDVDLHHTVEDVGITLGRALRDALGDGSGITRYGQGLAPMDDALVMVATDFSGRPYADLHGQPLPPRALGGFHTDLVIEWLWGLARGGGMTIHAHVIAGRDAHHMVEACFKGLGLALGQSVARRGRGIPSTKGVLWE